MFNWVVLDGMLISYLRRSLGLENAPRPRPGHLPQNRNPDRFHSVTCGPLVLFQSPRLVFCPCHDSIISEADIPVHPFRRVEIQDTK